MLRLISPVFSNQNKTIYIGEIKTMPEVQIVRNVPASAALIAHTGGKLATRADIAALPTPESTRTFKAVPHIELIRSLEAVLAENRIAISSEKFAIARNDNVLFGALTLEGLNYDPAMQGFGAAMALRQGLDSSLSIQIGCGSRVFICDNMAFSSDFLALKRKHTSRLDLMAELRAAVQRYLEKFYAHIRQFARLKEVSLAESDAKLMIYDIFAAGLVANRYLPAVHESYFRPDGQAFETQYAGTAWALHNAFTWVLKNTTMAAAQKATQAIAPRFMLTA